MSSRIIDVAIGLALVFALTSLLVATLVETLSMLLKKRGSVLKQAITSFVGDDASLATMLLRQPLLVSLAPQTKNDDKRRPSYISPDVMITSLLSYLIQNYAQGVRPSSPAELVAAVNSGGLAGAAGGDFAPANVEFQKGLAGLVHGVENDWPGYEQRLQAWYDSVTQRSVGWYKRWSSRWVFIIGFIVAAGANIDPIVIGPRLWNDAALRETVAAAGQEASKQYGNQVTATEPKNADSAATTAPPTVANGAAPMTSPQPGALIQASLPRRVPQTRAVVHDYLLLEQSLGEAADAARLNPKDAAASARRQIFEIMRDLPHTLNDTRLPDDGTPAFLEKNEKAIVQVDWMLRQLETLIPQDTPGFRIARLHRDQLEKSIAAERKALDRKKAQQKRDRDCEAVDDPNARQLCMRMSDLTQLHDAGLPVGWSPPAWPDLVHKKSDAKCFDEAANSEDKDISLCDHRWDPVNVVIAVFGWIITGIAATLGAPFWFDMLGRLVKLRGAGTRVDGSSTQSGDSPEQKASTLSTSTPGASDTTVNREPMSDALNEAEKSLPQSDIERIQRALKEFGAAVTATFDGLTRDAIKRWQKTRNADVTGELTPSQIHELLNLAPRDEAYAG